MEENAVDNKKGYAIREDLKGKMNKLSMEDEKHTSDKLDSPRALFSASRRRSFSALVSLKECFIFSNSLDATALFTAFRVRLLKLAVCLFTRTIQCE